MIKIGLSDQTIINNSLAGGLRNLKLIHIKKELPVKWLERHIFFYQAKKIKLRSGEKTE